MVCLLALGGLFLVERFRIRPKQDYYGTKVAAATLARDAFLAIKAERLKKRLSIDLETDPTESGLVGIAMSEVTSKSGKLTAKQTSVNPNFAAVVVQMLKDAKVQKGDVVAIGFSGSFPALNVCVLAAVETLQVRPIIITGITASQWGANEPQLLWPDMEKVMQDHSLIHSRTVAASIGGIDDRGRGMSKFGRDIVTRNIQRHGIAMLQPKSYEESIDLRMALYREQAGEAQIKAYINVGGVTSSIGKEVGRREFKPGLNRYLPHGMSGTDSVMGRFLNEEGAAVINLREVETLARTYGLPAPPVTMPLVGEGAIYFREQYNPWLAVVVLATVLGSIWAFMRTDVGFRMLQMAHRDRGNTHPEPMV